MLAPMSKLLFESVAVLNRKSHEEDNPRRSNVGAGSWNGE